MENKYEINCDYEVVLLLSDNSEMLIGGSEKTINKALKNTYEPNLAVKDLDIFFREQSLGTFALDLCSSFPETEKIQEQVDRLYANLKDENTNKSRVAETLNTLDYIFKVDKSTSVRLLARVVLKMYRAVTGLYMNARFGLGMKQSDRAELGEQFRKVVETMISDTFTTLKKKKSPQNTEILSVILFDCGDVALLSIRAFSKAVRYSALSAGSAAAIFSQSPETRFIARSAGCSARRTARRSTVRNAPREFSICGRGSSTALRISCTRKRAGTGSRRLKRRSIGRCMMSLLLGPGRCSRSMRGVSIRS